LPTPGADLNISSRADSEFGLDRGVTEPLLVVAEMSLALSPEEASVVVAVVVADWDAKKGATERRRSFRPMSAMNWGAMLLRE